MPSSSGEILVACLPQLLPSCSATPSGRRRRWSLHREPPTRAVVPASHGARSRIGGSVGARANAGSRLAFDPMSTSRALTRLARPRRVVRRRDPSDRRINSWLTEAGQDLYRDLARHAQRRMQMLLADLSAQERQQLQRPLDLSIARLRREQEVDWRRTSSQRPHRHGPVREAHGADRPKGTPCPAHLQRS